MNSTERPQRDPSQEQKDKLLLEQRMHNIKHKILVLSGKGGVGKSTVAANLARWLAESGGKTGLLDVDIHGPSIPKLLGVEGQRLVNDASGGIAPLRVDHNLGVVSVGFLLKSESDAVIWRGPMKFNVIRQFLRDVVWGDLDYLVIDSPPGTGDEPLSVAQLAGEGTAAVIVTTPQDLAVSDVRRSVSFCNSLSLRVIGIIENMSGLICPHCNKPIDLFKKGGGQSLAAEMNVPFLGCIPIDPDFVVSGDSGTAIYKTQRSGKQFEEVFEKIKSSL